MNRIRTSTAAASVGLVLFFATAANAVPLFSVGGNLGQSMFFDQASGETDAVTDLSGAILNFAFGLEIVNGATFEWTGSGLDADTSDGFGLASADFLGGGTITITGDLKQFGSTVVTNDVLLQGTLSAFEIHENSSAPGFLDSAGAIFTPVSGALVNGPWGAEMPNPYSFTFSIIGAQNAGGGAIEDFQSDVSFTQGTTFNMFEVPEPSTLIIFLGLGMGVVLPKRR
jgi:hypothetical protein